MINYSSQNRNFSEQLAKLSNLRRFGITDAQEIRVLPTQIGMLTKLEDFFIPGGVFTTLPTQVG